MGSLDRGFENALELGEGEVIRWSHPAMYRIGRVWIGGKLFVSDRRLFFCPGVLTRGRYGVLRLPLAEIEGVELLGRKFAKASVANGGLRPRVQVSTSAGEDHSFSMQRLAKHGPALQALLAAD